MYYTFTHWRWATQARNMPCLQTVLAQGSEPSWPCPSIPFVNFLQSYCNFLEDVFLLFYTPHSFSLLWPHMTGHCSSAASTRVTLTQKANLAFQGIQQLEIQWCRLRVMTVLQVFQPHHFFHLQFHYNGEVRSNLKWTDSSIPLM